MQKRDDCGERNAEKGLWGKGRREGTVGKGMQTCEEGTVVKGMQTRGEGSVENGMQGGDGGDKGVKNKCD